jgi:hypothetical protein
MNTMKKALENLRLVPDKMRIYVLRKTVHLSPEAAMLPTFSLCLDCKDIPTFPYITSPEQIAVLLRT